MRRRSDPDESGLASVAVRAARPSPFRSFPVHCRTVALHQRTGMMHAPSCLRSADGAALPLRGRTRCVQPRAAASSDEGAPAQSKGAVLKGVVKSTGSREYGFVEISVGEQYFFHETQVFTAAPLKAR